MLAFMPEPNPNVNELGTAEALLLKVPGGAKDGSGASAAAMGGATAASPTTPNVYVGASEAEGAAAGCRVGSAAVPAIAAVGPLKEKPALLRVAAAGAVVSTAASVAVGGLKAWSGAMDGAGPAPAVKPAAGTPNRMGPPAARAAGAALESTVSFWAATAGCDASSCRRRHNSRENEFPFEPAHLTKGIHLLWGNHSLQAKKCKPHRCKNLIPACSGGCLP